MKRWTLQLLVLPVLTSAAQAAPQWDGSIDLASNHLLRGVSRSSDDPALSTQLQAGFANGLFAGLWGSTSRVRPADSTTVELAATLGFGKSLGDWAVRGSYSHYESPWQERSDFYRYDELTVDLRFRETLFLSASYSPNTSRYAWAYGPVWERDAFAYEASLQQELHANLHGHAGIGYYDLSDLFGEGYWYGSIGLGWSIRRWQLDLSYVDTSDAAERLSYLGSAGSKVLFTLSFNF